MTLSDGSMAVKRMQGEDESAWQQRRADLSAATHKKVIALIHAIIQVWTKGSSTLGLY